VTSDPFIDAPAHRDDRQSAEVIASEPGSESFPQHEHIGIKPQLHITAAVPGKSDPSHMVLKDRKARRFLSFVRQIGSNDGAARGNHFPIPSVDQRRPAVRSVIRDVRHLRLMPQGDFARYVNRPRFVVGDIARNTSLASIL
jgi:hypothetical protein